MNSLYMRLQQSKVGKVFFDKDIYKGFCVAGFMLSPSVLFCFYPKIVSLIFILWGGVILLFDILTERRSLKPSYSIFLALFCVGYAVTFVLYGQNNIISTIHVFIWAIIEFFLLFAFNDGKSCGDIIKSLSRVNVPVVAAAALAGISSSALYLCKLSVVMPDPEGLNTAWVFGVTNGRSSGIFNNPIPLAAAMYIGMAACIYNFLYRRYKRSKFGFKDILYLFVLVICYINIQTTLTRTYVYGAIAFVGVAAGIYAMIALKGKRGAVVRWCACLLVCAASVAVMFGLRFVVQQTVPRLLAGREPIIYVNGNRVVDGKVSKEECELIEKWNLDADITMERDEISRLPSFFYPRNELWRVAMQVLPHSPVLGFTSGNLESSSLEYGSGEYFEKSWKTGIPTYHNAYVDIAVSSGLLGLAIILLFLIFVFVRSLRAIVPARAAFEAGQGKFYALMCAYCIVHVFFVSMFFGVLLFTNISVCIYFWIVLGAMNAYNQQLLSAPAKLSVAALFRKRDKKAKEVR